MGGCCVSKQSENTTSSQRGGGVRRRRRRRHNNNNSNNDVTSFTDLSNSAQSGGGAGMTFSTSSKSGGTGTTGSSSGRTLTDEEGSYSSYSGSDDGSSRSGEEDLRVWFEREKKKVDAARMAEKERKEALAAQLGTHNQHWQGFGVGAGGPPLAGSPTSPNYTNNNSCNNRHDRETSNNNSGGGAGQSFPSYNTLGGAGGNTSVSNPLQPNGIVDFPSYDAFDSRNPSLYSESQLRRHAGPSSNGSNHSIHDAGSTTVVSGLQQPNSFLMGSNSGSGRGSVHGNSLGANNSLFSQPQSGRLGSRVSESLDSQSSGRAGSLFQPSTLFGGSNRSGRQDSAQGSSLNTAATTTTTSSSVRSGNSDSLYSGGSGSGRKTSQGTAASSSFGRSSNATTPSPAHSQYSNQSSSHQQLPGAQTIMSHGEVFIYGGGRGDDGLDKSGSQAEKIFVQQSVVLPPRMDTSPFSSVRSSLLGGGGGGGGPSSADGSHGSNSGSGGGSNSSVGAVPIRPPRSPSEVSQPPVIVTHRKTSISKTSSSLPSSPASVRSGSQRFSVESSTSQQINIQLNSRSASEQRTTFSTASTASSDGTKIFSDESGSRDETMFRHKKNSVTNSLNTIGEFVNNEEEQEQHHQAAAQEQHGLVAIGSSEDASRSPHVGPSTTNDGLTCVPGLSSLSATLGGGGGGGVGAAGSVGSDDDDSFVKKQPGASGNVVTVARLRELSTNTGDSGGSSHTHTATFNSTGTEGEGSVASTGPLNNDAHIPAAKHQRDVSPPPASTPRTEAFQDHSSANASLTSPIDRFSTAAGSSTTSSSETPLPHNRRTSRTNRRGIPDADAETVAPDVRSISVGDLPSMDGSTTPNSGCASMTNSVNSSNGSANLLSGGGGGGGGGGAATTVQVTKGGHHHHHRAKFIHMMSSGDNSIDSKRSSGGGSSGDSKVGSGGPLEESSLHNGSSSTQCFE